MANKLLLGRYVLQQQPLDGSETGTFNQQQLELPQVFMRHTHDLEFSSLIPNLPISYEVCVETLHVKTSTVQRFGPYKIVMKPFRINKWLPKFFPRAGKSKTELASFWTKLENVNFPPVLTGTVDDILAVYPKADTVKMRDYIDKGSEGVIHKIEWSGEQFAVKLHSTEESFKYEAGIHFALQHPHIVKPCGYVELKSGADMKFGIIMELMKGDFENFMRNKREHEGTVPFQREIDAVDVMLQLARALMYMHAHNIIHRDVKPSNMLIQTGVSHVASGVEVKLGDFGTAKVVDTNNHTACRGTLFYWAPEVIKVEEGTCGYTLKADVYSFGMTCYAILTGKTPLAELSELSPEKFYKEVRGSWILPGRRPHLPRKINSSLAKIIQQCWHDKPEQRPPFDIICWALEIVKSQMAGIKPSLDDRDGVYPLKVDSTGVFGINFAAPQGHLNVLPVEHAADGTGKLLW